MSEEPQEDMEQYFPRDPKRLLREVGASIRIRDIEEWGRLREAVEIKWWESALVALLFISGVGILVTISQLIPAKNPLLYKFILAWSVLWILTLITCIEFLVIKFRALRRMSEISDRLMKSLLEDLRGLEARLEEIEARLGPAPGGEEEEEPASAP